MIVIKAKYFDHVKRDWVYLQDENPLAASGPLPLDKGRKADALFYSYPDAQDAVMRRQRRAYNEDEFMLEQYVVCECGALVKHELPCCVCTECGATYDRWSERIWTSYRA